MAEWWAYALMTVAVLCLLSLALPLLGIGGYLVFLEIIWDSRIRKRAEHDYRTARGTQHLRQLRKSLSVLRETMRAKQAKVDSMEKQLGLLRRNRSADLNVALSTYLVKERLTEVPGIGSKLSRRIVQRCFKGNLRDLRYASSIQGVGPARQQAIMAWVYAMEREFPNLLARDFPGKQHALGKYSEQERSLQTQLESEGAALGNEKTLYEKAHAAYLEFSRVKLSHFHKALKQGAPKSPIPAWYFEGVYPPWEPMPEWFETLLGKYGG